jgi:hypothetical protein
MADNNNEPTNEESTTKTREEKLAEVHALDKVYPTGLGGNDNETFDAYIKGEEKTKVKIPITTVKLNKMESHFTFDTKPAEE